MKKWIIVFLAIWSGSAFAHNGNGGWVTISNYQLWSNTYDAATIRISILGDTVYNPANCTDPDSYMVSTALSPDAQNRIYSTLLAALLADKSIVLKVDTAACEGGKVKLQNVRFQR